MTALGDTSSEMVSIWSKDSAFCTRALSRWKSEMLPATSADAALELLLHFSPRNDNDSVVSTLLAIINDELAFITTEGHRESSVDILRGLMQRAFGKQETYDEAKIQDKAILQSLFQHCSVLFERRMSRGSAANPLEQSEHIRLSLVELMAELGKYLILHRRSVATDIICEAASCICQTLAKHVFHDSFPDILVAACALIQTLAKLSPAAVDENATDLLLQFAGKEVKHCLFRNRRSMIRSKAIEASCAIVVLCCQGQAVDVTCSNADDDSSILSSTPLQQALQIILLPGWEDLLKMDTSVSVRVAVLNAVGMVAKQFNWTYSPTKELSGKDIHRSMELTSLVESNLLTLLVLGTSDGNILAQESATQQMSSILNFGSYHRQGSGVPWDVIARYFHPVMDLILSSCSLSWSTCKGRVRSLEALQVLLSYAIAILDSDVVIDDSRMTLSPRMQPVVECLRKNLVSGEKDVVQAALNACSILGGSNTCSTLVLDMLVASNEENIELSIDAMAMISSPREAASTMLLLSRMVNGMICNEDAAAILRRLDSTSTLSISAPNWIYTSPLSMATITTLLSHFSVTSIVSANPSFAWALLNAVSEVVKCCMHHLSSEEEVHDDSWTLKEKSVLEILICIVQLLGCKEAHGLSEQANEILHEFSSCFILFDADHQNMKLSLLDVHFRKLVGKIADAADSTFPWKESDPTFIAMAALLQTVEGSTVLSNFDLAAPFFVQHMSSAEIDKGGEAEEYSLRMTLMSLLQCILSDHSLVQVSGTTDILLSLVLPNLAWRPGGLASALRKLSVATVFSLLRHLKRNKDDSDSELHADTLTQLIPVLHSCLEDTESCTREMACVCISLILENTSSKMIQKIWETDARVLDTLQPCVLSLLDDSHKPVRLSACRALKRLLTLVNRELSSSEKVVSSLIVYLDDDDHDVRDEVLNVLQRHSQTRTTSM